jgi:hypothetical protein
MRKDNRLVGLPWTIWNFDGDGNGGADAGATGWTVLGNDTVNLAAVTTRRVRGDYALEFDKTNGDADTKLAGAYRTVDLDLTANSYAGDSIGWYVYVSAITDVDYTFLRIGTSSSHYVEYRVCVNCLTAGRFEHVSKPLSAGLTTGNGCDWSNVDYLAVGVAFRIESDALADIAVDNIAIHPHPTPASNEDVSLNVDGTSYQDDTATPNVSPDTDVGTTPVALAIPAGCKWLHLRASAAIRFGTNATLDGTADEGYDYLPAYEASGAIPVLDGTAVYVRINAASGTCSVWYRFEKRTG